MKMKMMGSPDVLRAEKEIIGLWDQSYMEKRQVFLRSYQFSRKKSSVERIKRSIIRVRRLIWIRLRAAPKLPRILWFRLRGRYGHGYCYRYSRLNRMRFQSSPSTSTSTA